MDRTVVSVKCSNCGATVGELLYVSGFSTRGAFGPRHEPCPGCGAPVSTGRSEWADLSGWSRFGYLAKLTALALAGILLWGFAFSFVLAHVLFMLGKIRHDQELRYALWLAAILSAVIGVRMFVNARREIRDSLRRTAGSADTT